MNKQQEITKNYSMDGDPRMVKIVPRIETLAFKQCAEFSPIQTFYVCGLMLGACSTYV